LPKERDDVLHELEFQIGSQTRDTKDAQRAFASQFSDLLAETPDRDTKDTPKAFAFRFSDLETPARDTKDTQRAFASPFSETPALKTTWERAAVGLPNNPEGFRRARRRFWRAVNSGASPEAKEVGNIVREAGYELQDGTNAPLLTLRGPVTDRRLSIDHMTPKSCSEELILRSANLRFMSQRDNSSRGDRYSKYDLLFGIDPGCDDN
jgi:hypothetical protein